MVAVYCKTFTKDAEKIVHQLYQTLLSYRIAIQIYKPFQEYMLERLSDGVGGVFTGSDDLAADVKLLLSVGGDGTFLDAVEIVRHRGIAVAGVNIGRLGFLANIAKEDVGKWLEKMHEGAFEIEERTLIHATIEGKPAMEFPYALNDAVIHKTICGLITVHTWSNTEFLNSYWADGLIVATPTGSTAYSLSVGGPVVAPESQNFIISPIAAHNLNVRPLVIPDNVTLKLKAECREKNQKFTLALDSRSMEFKSGTEIELKRADFKIRTIKTSPFYTTLRNKLMWGVDKRN